LSKLFVIRKKIPKRIYTLLTASSFVLLIAAWVVLTEGGFIKAIILPTPRAVVQYIIESAINKSLWRDMGISFYRILGGFVLAVLLGIPLGILVGTFKTAEAFMRPLCEFIRYMPVPAFVPLIMIWVGIGEEAKMAVIFMGTLFQLIPIIADNIMSVPDDLINAAYTLGANRRQSIFKVLIPGVMPKIMETLRVMMGWAWTYLVTAELVAANSGLGYSILKAQRFLKTDAIFGGILVIGLLGLVIDRTMAYLNKKMFPWYVGVI